LLRPLIGVVKQQKRGRALNWSDFHFAFWHPFGPYCGLSPEEVLDWKRSEVAKHGWTFWSFAYARTAEMWQQVLHGHTGPVHILCSHSPNAKDPFPNREAQPPRATHYRLLDGQSNWKPMPAGDGAMYVTNPFKRQGLATAFKVTHVEYLKTPVTPCEFAGA
jgi:hypothetical protein